MKGSEAFVIIDKTNYECQFCDISMHRVSEVSEQSYFYRSCHMKADFSLIEGVINELTVPNIITILLKHCKIVLSPLPEACGFVQNISTYPNKNSDFSIS